MASTAALDLVISLKSEGAESGLKNMATHVSALGTAVGTFAGGAALAGVRALGGAVSGFLGDAIQESRDAAHGLAQTESVIKSTGGAAKVTAGQIVDMAGALSHSTLFTDDAIQADENLLLTFTNLKNGVGAGNDIFTQATRVSLDLAQAMGTDASGGAVQLGKALNDPTAGISALTRVGVTFTDQQKKQIKTLQDSGNLMGAQKIILGELNKEFGGSAEAAAKADGGFHLFNQRLSDVKQTIGDALQPALQSLMGFMAGPGLDAVESLGNSIAGGLTTAVTWLGSTAIPNLMNLWASLTDAFKADGIGGAIESGIEAIGFYVPALASVTDFLSANFWPAWDAGVAIIGNVHDALMSVWNIGQLLITGDFSGGIFGLDEDSGLITFLFQVRDGFGIARDGVLTFIQALQGDWVNSSGVLPLHAAIGELGLFITGTLVPAFQAFVGFVQANAAPILAGLGAMLVAVVVPAFVAWAVAAAASAAATIAALAGIALPIAAIGLAVAALYAAWTSDFGGIQTNLTAWWNGTGLPIFTQLRTWLAVTIPAAITVLAGFWTGTLQPALSAVWTFITGSVIPTLTTLATGAMVAVGTAVTTLAGFWTGTLQPALTAVWSFIQTSLVPLFTALANVTIAALKLEVTALAGLWQNVLQPALSAVWTFISGSLQPVIAGLASFFTGTFNPAVNSAGSTLSTVLGPAITAVTGFFGGLYTAIGGISGAISTVIGWLNSLAGKLNSLKLPAWLTPGSPTPFEWGLRGIADAAQMASKALGPLLDKADGMTAPNLTTPAAVASAPAGDAGTNAGSTFGPAFAEGITASIPQAVTTTRDFFTTLQDTVILPWQTMTRDFFSGAGFGFIGAASEGMNSAGGGLAASASNVGGMAGASLVSSLQSNVAGVSSVVNSINAELARIERDIHIKVSIDRGGGSGGAAQTSWNESIGI
jgi:hypothetical protein